jgi:hypothetical protein
MERVPLSSFLNLNSSLHFTSETNFTQAGKDTVVAVLK